MVNDEAAYLRRILDLAVSVQQIPSPTFHEQQCAAFLKDIFLEEGLKDVAIDAAGNLFGRLPGTHEVSPLVISAHVDTVFPANTNLACEVNEETIHGASIGDNSLGVAGLLGILWRLRKNRIVLPGDVWFVANTGEEGLGNLEGMRCVVDRFGSQPRAYLILEGMALGQIIHRGLGVVRFRITMKTTGGHSWADYGKPSAIHELAKLIALLDGIPVPEEPRASLNVGVIAGGVSINTIAPQAWLEVDLRSVDADTLTELSRRVTELAESFRLPGVDVLIEKIGQRPAGGIPANHPLVRTAENALRAEGFTPRLNIASTDANIPLSKGLPAVCIGLTTGKGAHTTDETIDVPPLAKGMNQVYRLVLSLFGVNPA